MVAPSHAHPTTVVGTIVRPMEGGFVCRDNAANRPAVKATAGARRAGVSGWIMVAGLSSQ